MLLRRERKRQRNGPSWLLIVALVLLTSRVIEECNATGQRYNTPSPTQELDNTLQSVPPTGPNVCRSRFKNYCCPGWSKKPETGLCVIPVCTRRCGTGRCIRPNICLCEGGTVASTCGSISTKLSTHESNSNVDRGESGRCRVHCINGNCVDGRCQCRSGYQGEFCNEPICREPCLNQGRCIGPDRCACIYGYTGRRCETDYRTGPCYTKVKNGQCLANLQGVVCTRQLCCATVGKGWGHPCERCPMRLDCELGYLKTSQGQCVDINECEAIPGLCEGGKCVNTQGSFTCDCPEGQARDPETNECKDRDECQEEGICADGRCVNTNGGYYCLCNPGFIQSQDRRFCIDGRQGLCYTAVNRNGQCKNRLTMRLSKKDCCCGKNMGKGWGDECFICPNTGSEDYNRLCAQQPQQFTVINECALRPEICGNGKCVDTKEGYECECYPGFTKRNGRCEDIDECQLGYCQGGTCRNYEGSFICQCPPGFTVSGEGKYCTDHDECQDTGMCNNGHCINMNGSFRCKCNDGYTLSPTKNTCIDINECTENPRICLNGRCENTPGSYHCICQSGFTPSRDNTFCVDMDECSTSGMCENGKCVNMEGSFKCVCDSGFRIGPDQSHCIDIDECLSAPCQNGRCINTLGSFRCECHPGFNLGPDGRSCLDTRRDLCYSQYRDGQCSNPTSTAVTKSSCCCCTIILGQPMGWGSTCQPCPLPGTSEFDSLCPHGAGMTYNGDDINECAQNPNICINGGCENLMGTYRCICDNGYEVDATGKICSDINECELEESLCSGGQCRNTPGGYQCICPTGTRLKTENQMCEDIDECEELGPDVCFNGICVNVPESYECECSPGYILDNTGHICMDNRKGSCWTKMVDGRCENNLPRVALRSECCCSVGVAWGSPCEVCDHSLCECSKGYAKVDGKSCVDVNECELNAGICRGGGTCVNTDGSYRCECPPGLTLDPTHTTCVDTREETCYLEYRHGQCSTAIEGHFSKSLCCCSVGRAWGSEKCEACPKTGTHAHSELCPRGIGFTERQDINECIEFPGMCVNGRCKNTVGSYSCRCNQGFALDEHGIKCNDIDECEIMHGVCGNGTCRNTPGNFQCDCNSGYRSSDIMKICMDINECDMFSNLCVFGRCENIFGMFRCECNEGYKLDGSGGNCTDIDECESPQSCQYGTCINTQGKYICQCPPHYELVDAGNACVDRRDGFCYAGFEHGTGRPQCVFEMSTLVTKATCCCSIGTAWGNRCEECPKPGTKEFEELCPGGMGYRPNRVTVILEDINECEEHENICQNGHCTNTFGSFMCSCNEGFVLDDMKTSCVDINECALHPYICSVGRCINDQGKYHCECPEGYITMPGGKECVDTRKESCYLTYESGQCFNPMAQPQTKMLCCCSMGAAWGSPCERCPPERTREHEILCGLVPGQIMNPITNHTEEIDECALMPTMCTHGRCLNTPGSFECQCEQGYVYDQDSHQCIDENECLQIPNPCSGNAQCINQQGYFECVCPAGYKLGISRRDCIDIDECFERSGICNNAACNNLQGSFQCVCHSGFTLTHDRENCVDIDECQRNPNICNNGTCINILGSYKCQCYDGFKLSPNNDCADIDECRIMPFLCRNGRCRNTVGTFICECADGYILAQDRQHCRDVDECHEIPGLCPYPGKCQNLMGSYICSCPPGYELNNERRRCVDIDECIETIGICENGQCINTDGGVICECPVGFQLSDKPNSMRCIDVREEQCYDSYRRGQCSFPRKGGMTKKHCCCTMGKAWGKYCEQCPPENSEDFRRLCPEGVGRDDTGIDLNECLFMPDACSGGECINTDGSFRCECPSGYILDETGRRCIDNNECLTVQNICGNGTCTNIDGGFECSCNEGFTPGVNQICEDVNECLELGNQCAFRCHNAPGSFRCICPYGYTLAPDGRHCIDVDECATPANNCKYQCKNLIGTFMCICPPGYQQIGMADECKDINECAINSGLCRHGRCVNLEGSYQCYCYDGFEQSVDGKSCIDRRVGYCFLQTIGGRCTARTSELRTVTKADCCCTMGAAWGPHCEICPSRDSDDYNELCLDKGFSLDGQDIDECKTIPDLCRNGICINTMGSYRCICNKGYKSDKSGAHCIDVNECELTPKPCKYNCQNTEGSFICSCPAGFILNPDGISCRDLDECATGNHLCQQNCVNTQGSYTCGCREGYTQDGDACHDIDECEQPGTCPKPGTCVNTLGSFRCICPRGFKLDQSGRFCTDHNECADDSNCEHGCQNFMGSYRCGCPEGFVQHLYYSQCIDENECSNSPCGENTCINTIGSYKCGCPDGYQFDNNLQICVQVSAGCLGSPCAFGCTPNGANGFICGCPTGYQRIGQGHCLSTINPLSQSNYGEEIGNVPTYVINPDPYHIPPADDKTISTEGCFSCKINGKGRRRRGARIRSVDEELQQKRDELMKRRVTRKARRHHHGEEHVMKISLRQTKHRMRIIKLQPAIKDEDMEYTIVRGNKHENFEIAKDHGIWALHFRSRLKKPGQFRIVIHGRPRNGITAENEIWEKPLTFRIHLIVTE
ncbi:fibrillin-2-like isoform X2 [Vespula pensylvanica]|uniref:fibrillin-2-like isoform X2 n=1 Tax=Vespula pensylvanica TaxID=30213 RepID=UPI001CBA0FE2|nr:fibrillin-2-like isoform X2 [Vespula pensylvanica]